MTKIKQSLLAIVIGLALAAGVSYAWTGPVSAPPAGNTDAPLNVGTATQYKSGALGIGGLFLVDGPAIFNGQIKIANGTQGDGKVLTSDANGNASWQTRGGFTNFQVWDQPGTYNFTIPSGVNKIMIEVWGGGSDTAGSFGGSAGAGGGYGRDIFIVSPGNNYDVIVGAGGLGNTLLSASGKSSKFGSLIEATGGQIGAVPNTIGGTSNARFNISGENGLPGGIGGAGANGGMGGINAFYGEGLVCSAPKAPGGGSAGSCIGYSAASGYLSGAPGRVVVWW